VTSTARLPKLERRNLPDPHEFLPLRLDREISQEKKSPEGWNDWMILRTPNHGYNMATTSLAFSKDLFHNENHHDEQGSNSKNKGSKDNDEEAAMPSSAKHICNRPLFIPHDVDKGHLPVMRFDDHGDEEEDGQDMVAKTGRTQSINNIRMKISNPVLRANPLYCTFS
jgi:hypothetical protein